MFDHCPNCFQELTYSEAADEVTCNYCRKFQIYYSDNSRLVICFETGFGKYNPVYYYVIEYGYANLAQPQIEFGSSVEERYGRVITTTYPIVFDDITKLFDFIKSVENGTNQEVLFL